MARTKQTARRRTIRSFVFLPQNLAECTDVNQLFQVQNISIYNDSLTFGLRSELSISATDQAQLSIEAPADGGCKICHRVAPDVLLMFHPRNRIAERALARLQEVPTSSDDEGRAKYYYGKVIVIGPQQNDLSEEMIERLKQYCKDIFQRREIYSNPSPQSSKKAPKRKASTSPSKRGKSIAHVRLILSGEIIREESSYSSSSSSSSSYEDSSESSGFWKSPHYGEEASEYFFAPPFKRQRL